MNYIKSFSKITLKDDALVGGKTASLGEMVTHLSSHGIRVPLGFAITAKAYWHVVDKNKLHENINAYMRELPKNPSERTLHAVGKKIRTLFLHAEIPADLKEEIAEAYQQLSKYYRQHTIAVAVRSSATAEDLPGASFAGQQETFLHVQGITALEDACKKCFASLFTDRAILYRLTKGFDYRTIALSIAVQKMVRSDKACSGVAFSLDTESGFKDVVLINGSYGLGEAVVQGEVTPDEFHVFKPTLQEGLNAIISKKCGSKEKKLVYGTTKRATTVWKKVLRADQLRFCLTDKQILELSKAVVLIEKHYTTLHKQWTPMDIEWAQDGDDGHMYIVQARPETVHAQEKKSSVFTHYVLSKTAHKKILEGQSIGQKIAAGCVKIVKNVKHASSFNDGDILVTVMTDPDWLPLIKRASGIITDAGGRTCHAAIVSRELGIPAVIGTERATTVLKNNQEVTLDCSQGNTGYVYQGKIPFFLKKINVKKLPEPAVKLMVNLGDPSQAFTVAQLPHLSGVGLARLEFIIATSIKVHPMACIEFSNITNKKVKQQITDLTYAYKNKKEFFVDSLSYGIAMIAAAFYPRPVIVRFSDFKSNEYRNLLGGTYFEPEEHNPMLGLRGASRYYSALYEKAFALECAAMHKVRKEMGLFNVIPMIPFVRTVDEAKKVLQLMKLHGLHRGQEALETYMMVEVPSNVLLIDQFSALFDGFSIGSNDLTQCILAVDRDSSLLADLFDEENEAVKIMISQAIKGALENKKPIGLCGQIPSDSSSMARFLIHQGVTSLSLNPDAVLSFLMKHIQ